MRHLAALRAYRAPEAPAVFAGYDVIQQLSHSEQLAAYDWPGNIRELGNVIERAVVLSRGPVLTLAPGQLPAATGERKRPRSSSAPAAATSAPTSAMREVEREHILAVLEQTGGVVEGPRGAASILELHPNTWRSRMKKLGIR